MNFKATEFAQIKDRGLYILKSTKWADCRFLVGGSPSYQKLFAGHKLILAMASPVFERMLFGELAEKNDPIIIPDLNPDTFEAMLEYIYSDNIRISSFDMACELCYAAMKYMLPHVVQHCIDNLFRDLSPENACRAFEFAKLVDNTTLVNESMRVIVANTTEVLADPGFTDIEMSTLMAILNQNKLNIYSELDLFEALERYANAKREYISDSAQNSTFIKEKNTEASTGKSMQHVEEIKMSASSGQLSKLTSVATNSCNPNHTTLVKGSALSEEMLNKTVKKIRGLTMTPEQFTEGPASPAVDKEMLKKAVKKIRFLTMSAQRFAEVPARSNLLQQDEAFAILLKILNSSNYCPMPEGFCTSRSSRNFNDYGTVYHKRGQSQRESVCKCCGSGVVRNNF